MKLFFFSVSLLISAFTANAQDCEAVKTENQRLKKENMFLKADNLMLKGDNLMLKGDKLLPKTEGENVAGRVGIGTGRIQTQNDIVFELLSATGDKKNQTVTVVMKITNKAANKEGFTTMIKSFSTPDGEEFAIKSSVIGKDGGFKTLSTDAPIRGTYVFGGILPKVTTIRMLAVPYQLLKGMYETYRVEFRDVSIDWK